MYISLTSFSCPSSLTCSDYWLYTDKLPLNNSPPALLDTSWLLPNSGERSRLKCTFHYFFLSIWASQMQYGPGPEDTCHFNQGQNPQTLKAASMVQLEWGLSQTLHFVHHLGLLQIQQESFLCAFQLHMTTHSNKYAVGMMQYRNKVVCWPNAIFSEIQKLFIPCIL